MSRKISLSDSDIKGIIRILMAEKSYKSMKEISNAIGMKDTTFRSAIDNETIRLKDFIKAINSMGYELHISESDE
ncbi:hypothetical protein [Brevibacillus laterosporus]|uniref:hypothetical protein n=1 Tax=Brevibacillus laterosporus TaxID=1465 RepID=UPI0018F8693F|nr:hypothetical protein [Brevibacillus laterosporus]MBG9776174.1 hypothetical protein [Brevibacillus laterosporus]